MPTARWGQGLLTGKITPEREYEEGDQRHHKKEYTAENVRKVHAILEPMRPIAQARGVTLAQLTMAWTLAQVGCSHVLCGARNAQQAVENAAAGDLELSDEELKQISHAVNSYQGV